MSTYKLNKTGRQLLYCPVIMSIDVFKMSKIISDCLGRVVAKIGAF